MSQPSPPSLDATVTGGLRWAALRQGVVTLVGTVGAVAYTQFLQPEDIGLFGLASLVYSGLLLLVQAPIRDAVVYYRDEEGTRSSAAFWLLLAFSTLAVALVMLFAGTFARMYHSPLAAPLTRWMAAAFFFDALAVVPAALLLKRFRFALHEGLQTIFQLVLLVGWVVLSMRGFGPWSLVITNLAGAVGWAVVMWAVSDFRPAFSFQREAYRDIIRFSRSLFGSKLILYLTRNLDNAAVGTLGERPLGWYTFGESQAAYAGLWVGATVAYITLPAMAATQHHLEKLRQTYLETLRLTATLSIPMQLGAIILADLGIALFFGEQWLGAVPVLQAYLTLWLIRALLEIGDAATSAIGRPDIRFKVDLFQLPFFIIATWIGLQFGGNIAAIAWSLALVRMVAGVVYFGMISHTLRLTLGDIRRYLLPAALAGLVMALIVYGARTANWLPQPSGRLPNPFLADALNLSLLILVGMASYFVSLYLLDRSGFKAVFMLAMQILLPPSWQARLLALSSRSG